jgi:hypothetical protein
MARKGPLRKIVGQRTEYHRDSIGMEHPRHLDILECGHEQRPVADFYGETHAERRRCKQCHKEQSGAARMLEENL